MNYGQHFYLPALIVHFVDDDVRRFDEFPSAFVATRSAHVSEVIPLIVSRPCFLASAGETAGGGQVRSADPSRGGLTTIPEEYSMAERGQTPPPPFPW
jgi:hypothetical protein